MLLLAGLVLVVFGLLHPVYASQAPASPSTVQEKATPGASVTGQGAGNSMSNAATEASVCSPFDTSCITDAIGQTVATAILSALQPVTTFFQNSSANIVTQTPPDDSYANSMVGTINQDLVDAVDAALACLLLIGGFNVIIGPHLRMEQSTIAEILPRAILVTCAVHFNVLFMGLFIDLNNAVCNPVKAVASEQTLANLIATFLSPSTVDFGSLVVVLVLVMAILSILLLVQMITRLALVALLIAVAPL